MALFYERFEYKNKIVIKYKNRLYIIITTFIPFILSFIGLDKYTSLTIALSMAALYIFDTWNAGNEVASAMRNGRVKKISGSLLSFSDLYTVEITKEP